MVGAMEVLAPALVGLRIVVVDDEPGQAIALATLLSGEGMHAASESSAQVALARIQADPPDVVILDVKMPGLSGTDLLTALHARHPELPVVLLTGYEASDRRLASALANPRVTYLGKPVEMTELLAALAALVSAKGAAPERARPGAAERAGA